MGEEEVGEGDNGEEGNNGEEGVEKFILLCRCTTCVGACKCKYDGVELRRELRSLFDFTCSCSSTASPDGSTHSYPSLVSRSRPAFGRLHCAELCCKAVHCRQSKLFASVPSFFQDAVHR